MASNYDEMVRECERAGSFENWARAEYTPSQCYDISESNSDGPIYTYQQMALFMEFALNRCQLQEWYDLADVGESFTDPMKMMEAQVLGAVQAICAYLWDEYVTEAYEKLSEAEVYWCNNGLGAEGIRWVEIEDVFEKLIDSPDDDFDTFLKLEPKEACEFLLKRV